MIVGQDVVPPGGGGVPYVRAGTVLTEGMISEMHRLGIRFAHISERVVAPGSGGGSGAAPSLPVIPKPKPVIAPQLRDNAVGTLQDMFSAASIRDVHESARIVKQLDAVVDQLIDSIQKDSGMLVNIGDLKSYDDYTFHHSLSVAVVSLAIGQHLRFDRAALRQLGMCAMMHDIGKTAVPIELIHKPSRLSDDEFAVIKNHSPAGYDYLVGAGIGDEEMWQGVLHHHEKTDGTGYPDGMAGEEIPVMSRILSVADVYDALTSNRPYREPMQPAEAVEYVMGGTGTAFDYDMVTAFLQRMELYPVGSRLLLSTGKFATVLSNENQMRPVVRLDSGEIMDLYRDKQCRSMVITRLLHE